MSFSRNQVLKGLKTKKAKPKKNPTVDELFEIAIDLEESGDRWRLEPAKVCTKL